MGHFLADGLNKLVDEVIVLLSFKAFVPPSDVQRIIQKLLIVGAHIQHDRQCPGWVYAADERVKRELADGDAQPTGTLVSNTQHPLTIGNDDYIHVPIGTIIQERRYESRSG